MLYILAINAMIILGVINAVFIENANRAALEEMADEYETAYIIVYK